MSKVRTSKKVSNQIKKVKPRIKDECPENFGETSPKIVFDL
tara:strand:+ start:594 stop:716 length:123 start_codon:yes stop_codon:yes gene_type:complete